MDGSTLDALRRAYLSTTRGVVVSVDDSKGGQTVGIRLMASEMPTKVERFQSYGFKSVPVAADQNGGNGMEAVVAFMHGNRAHPVVVADVDRRTAPKNWKAGDSGTWHHKGASAKHTDDGFVYDDAGGKLPYKITIGNCAITWADGKATIQVGGDTGPAVVVTKDAIFLGGDPAKGGSFGRVQTDLGFSDLVKAKVG